MKFTLYLTTLVFLVFLRLESKAQTATNQDCLGAVSLCDQATFSYQLQPDEGEFINELNVFNSCLNSGERNSFWVKFTIAQPGLLGFKITPYCSSQDIDFALFNLTNAQCSDIFGNAALEVACSFSGSTFPTTTTGMSNTLIDMNGFIYNQVTPMIEVVAGETYYLLINNFTGECISTPVSVDVSESTCTFYGCSYVNGRAFLNVDASCEYDTTDFPVQTQIVSVVNTATNNLFSGLTDEAGNFSIVYPNMPGFYQLQYTNYAPTTSICNITSTLIENTGIQLTTDNTEISLTATENCTYLKILHDANILRNCRNNYRFVRLENLGTQPANNVELTLEYHPEITPLSVNYPFTFINTILTVQIPQLLPFAHVNVEIFDTISCNVIAGDEICINATTNIPNTCSSIIDSDAFEIYFDCDNNKLKLFNIGNDELVQGFYLGYFGGYELVNSFTNNNLAIGDSLILENINSDAAEFQIILRNTDQEYLFNGNVNCLTDSVGLVRNTAILPNRSYPLNCEIIRNSYDPNDKQGFPAGLSEENLLLKDQEIKYKIRFQNTGNDTAFTVIIRDTLDSNLDFNTIRIGQASHNYTFQQNGKNVAFVFNTILLPDSTTNEPASHGFIDFYIKQMSTNPENYSILNKAHIYFDFNDAIVTNTHVYNILEFGVGIEKVAAASTNYFYPIPTEGILFSKMNIKEKNAIKVIDLQGRRVDVLKYNSTTNSYHFSAELNNGFYIIQSETGEVPPQRIILRR